MYMHTIYKLIMEYHTASLFIPVGKESIFEWKWLLLLLQTYIYSR
jgi:hypothetical protein